MGRENQWISTIQGLIESCRAGQEGYRRAAEHVAGRHLRDFLTEQSERRGQFVSELKRPFDLIGPALLPSGPPGPGAWTLPEDKLRNGDESILGTLEAADEALRKQYRRALEGDLPPAVAETVRHQLVSFREADDLLNLLHERRKAA
ncbi:MAG: DUF2383 domain-containing protein [Terriglobales bacterium]